MNLLLDTHTFLWWVADDKKLSTRARKAIASKPCFVSMATAWELSIKVSLGKLQLGRPAARFFEDEALTNRFAILAIQMRHLLAVESLPFHHGDPFDRMLVAQASVERLSVVTKDSNFESYGIKCVW